ncbi:MAG: response regulator transcription factor [Dehalococcoidia bacterium]|nr:response regulator transcription factor [Dehalococcoidia bacterium]
MNKKVLIIEDDRKTSHLVEVYLQRDGYRVATAYDGKEALDLARRTRPDLVILDLMLPEIDGLEVCRLLRAESKVPIIMLTARTSEDDRLAGLDIGADDYVTKPFSPRELVARVRAVLRRARDSDQTEPQEVSFGELNISFARHEVIVRGRAVDLTPTEFKILEQLARNPGRAFTRLQLIDNVRGLEFEGFERTIDVHVMNLRRKIEANPSQPRYVKTILGMGYKLEANPDVP